MNFSSKKVLIVEDDALLSIVEKRLVQKIGYEVVATVNNGRDALAEVKKYPPDIVLMDVQLQGDWNGVDTVEQLKNYFSGPVIYLSGSADDAIQKRAAQIGYSSFLIKPIKLNELKNALQQEPQHGHARMAPHLKNKKKAG